MSDPLSTEEDAKLHKLLEKADEILKMNEADQRARWFWTGARGVALWITAVLGAVAITKTYLLDMFGGKH